MSIFDLKTLNRINDVKSTGDLYHSYLPNPPSWADKAGLKHVALLQSARGMRERYATMLGAMDDRLRRVATAVGNDEELSVRQSSS